MLEISQCDKLRNSSLKTLVSNMEVSSVRKYVKGLNKPFLAVWLLWKVCKEMRVGENENAVFILKCYIFYFSDMHTLPIIKIKMNLEFFNLKITRLK